MRKFQILLVLGVALVAAGGIGLLWSFLSASEDVVFTIPSGDYYYRFESVELMDGEVKGSFEVEFGAPLRMFVFSEKQYKDYSTIGYTDYLFTTSGLSGSFQADVNGTGKVYLVFEHDSNMVATRVHLTYTISGIAVTYMISGAAILVVGAGIVLMSLRIKRNATRRTPPSTATTDVTMFNDSRPPSR